MVEPDTGPPASVRAAGGVVLLFPGQGAQRRGMAVDLYRRHEPFRVTMDAIFEFWGGEGEAIRADWLSDDPVVGIDDFRRSQPLLFAIEVALAKVIRAAGIEPVALLGHSVGEIAAAVIAGVATVADAAAMLMERLGQLADAPSGGMLAVAASATEVEPLLRDGVSLAAVNGPKQIMVAGPNEPLERARLRLAKAGLITQRVHVAIPFHSPVLAPLAARSLSALESMSLSLPALPLYSGYTGALLGREATDPGFWAAQPARTVFFATALDAIARSGPCAFVEAGPWQLTALVRRHPLITRSGGQAFALLPRQVRTIGGAEHLAATLDQIRVSCPQRGSCSAGVPEISNPL
ncbi:MAG TPA: acyltransferase domain-containing protein [Amycolatopsis sp.]|uniref:acyltransferase domain-containing protein n=1 Tax=Amycolatopsis sp. TaxID=37632 RepID=UPI002B46625E|nr:acyltransferase domain-containing protein [Amycolatopsis sp.]HKS47139.1 acyltransferase domain-containing protein [Amycolatopsis sp.]